MPQDVIVNFIKIKHFNYNKIVTKVCDEKENKKNSNDIILCHQKVTGYLVA